MNNKQKYKTNVRRIIESLPYGGLSEVARRCDVSVKAVQDVRDGKFRNEKIVEMAMTVRQETIEKQRKHEERVEAFVRALPATLEPINSVGS